MNEYRNPLPQVIHCESLASQLALVNETPFAIFRELGVLFCGYIKLLFFTTYNLEDI